MFDNLIQLAKSYRPAVVLAAVLAAIIFIPAVRRGLQFVLRLLVRPLLLVALIALLNDGTRSIASDQGLVITSLLEHWQSLAPASLEAVKQTIYLKVHPLVWDQVVARPLRLPAWLAIGLLALMLSFFGRRRRQVQIFAN